MSATGQEESQKASAKEAFASYMIQYGGWRALFGSPFFHAAIIISLILFPTWGDRWAASTALSVVPAMLGFSIAAFTFSLGIGTDQFKLMLGMRLGKRKQSIVGTISTAFVHFVCVQTVALITSIICNAHWTAFIIASLGSHWSDLPRAIQIALTVAKWISGGLCTMTLCYAILSGLPAIFNIYGASNVFEDFATREMSNQNKMRRNKRVH